MAGKRKATLLGAGVGAKVAPKAGKMVGKAAWKAGKTQAKLTKHALGSREPRSVRFMKYGLFALAGFAVGALLGRAGKDSSSNGSGSGAGHQSPGGAHSTGADRDYSNPSSGPLIGEHHRGNAGDIPEQQRDVENTIRTRIGEDARTREMPHVNVEVNDGVAELRGIAASEEIKQAAGEIAADVEGVREVRNHLSVS